MKKYIFLLFFIFIGCKEAKNRVTLEEQQRIIEEHLRKQREQRSEDPFADYVLNCPSYENGCPEHFKRLWKNNDSLIKRQTEYHSKSKRFREENTYNKNELALWVEINNRLGECLQRTPLGNKEERRQFFAEFSSSQLKTKAHQTDRYYQNKLADHYGHGANCYKLALEELEEIIP